jgi:hypothetical protein
MLAQILQKGVEILSSYKEGRRSTSEGYAMAGLGLVIL